MRGLPWVRVLLVPGILFVIMLAGLIGALLMDGWVEVMWVGGVAAFLPVIVFVLWISPRPKREVSSRSESSASRRAG